MFSISELAALFTSLPQDRCVELSEPSYVNFSFSILILLGILVSYLPQHIRIVNRKSSFGLSPYFVLLGTTSGTCQFANILTLPGSRADMACCREIDGFSCFAGLLGIMQVGMQWTCFAVILLLFLLYFPRATPTLMALAKPSTTSDTDTDTDTDNNNQTQHHHHHNHHQHDHHQHKEQHPSFRTALAVAIICLVHALVTAVLSLYFTLAAPVHLQSWANLLGIVSTLLALLQYFPQIYTTWRLRRVASLSIPMMCIQTPGSFVWAASLAARLGAGGWSAWGVYVVTGCLQGSLLAMGIWFDVLGHGVEDSVEADESDGADQEDGEATEETPLIRER